MALASSPAAAVAQWGGDRRAELWGGAGKRGPTSGRQDLRPCGQGGGMEAGPHLTGKRDVGGKAGGTGELGRGVPRLTWARFWPPGSC